MTPDHRPPPTLYPGGFLVAEADREPALPDDELRELIGAWRSTRVGRYVVRYDETWRAHHAASGDAEALLLGTAMDVDAPRATPQEVADALAAALAASSGAFLNRMDALVGAHIVVARKGEGHWLQQDATGMETAAYDVGRQETLVASHPALVADIRGYEISDLGRLWLPGNPEPEAQEHKFWNGPWHTPGITSYYEHVRTLTPNTRLELGSRRIERIFPRRPIGILEMDEVVERVAGHLRDAYDWVAREYADRVSVSISGGLDSRLSLAASREHAHALRYFTYYYRNHPVHRNDLRLAETLAQRFGLDHRPWPLEAGTAMAASAAQWGRTHRGLHGPGRVEYAYLEHLPPGDLHVRANVLEVIRGYFLKHPPNRRDEFDAARLSVMFRTSVRDRFKAEYEEFMAVTGFSHEAKLDMHYTDLYHWEQRLGRWHAEVVRRSKVAHNTFIIWNARRVLTLMLARPAEDRWRARVVYRLMDRLWPEVLETPIFSGAKFVAPPAELPVGTPPFLWERLAPEIRTALARAIDPDVEAGDAARLLAEAEPAPTAASFERPGLVEAALADWLTVDPAALDVVYTARLPEPRDRRAPTAAERVRRIDRTRRRPAGEPLRRALAAALLAAGGRMPPVADRQALRPYLRVPTTGLNPTPLERHEEEMLAGLRAAPAGGIVESPPGAGARRVAARWLIEDAVRAGRKVLWIAQRVELLEQAALGFVEGVALLRERTEPVVMRLSGGAYGPRTLAGLADEGPDVTLASFAALARNLPALEALLSRHDVVAVVDGAHRAGAPAWREVMEGVRTGARAVVGLVPAASGTGDADREAAREAVGGGALATASIDALVAAGALARPRPERVQTGCSPDSELPISALGGLASGGFSARVAAALAGGEERDERIVAHWLRGRAANRYGSTVAYAIDADHARALAERFEAAGASAEAMGPLRPDRQAVLDRFRSRAFDVLVTVGPVAEGLDLPLADTVLLCRPTRSADLLAELCSVALRGPAAGGTEVASLVAFADRWEHLTGWLEPGDILDEGRLGALAPGLRRAAQDFEGLPAAWYGFEVEVAHLEDEREVRRHAVVVSQQQLAGYTELEAAAAADPEALPRGGAELLSRFFAGAEGPLPAAQDLALLAAYARAHGALPERRPFASADEVTPRQIARRIVEQDLRISETRRTIEEARAAAPELVSAFFGGPEQFAAEVLTHTVALGRDG